MVIIKARSGLADGGLATIMLDNYLRRRKAAGDETKRESREIYKRNKQRRTLLSWVNCTKQFKPIAVNWKYLVTVLTCFSTIIIYPDDNSP